MVKTTIVTTIIFFCLNTYGQNNETLSKKLWVEVNNCYSMFDVINEDGQVDYDEIIDDSKNGYLKVSGSFSTCGCNCISTVGAYRTMNVNEYVFVKKSTWGCSWKKEITSSDSLGKIFPIDFEIDGFFSKKIGKKKHATFYIDLEVPRKGTDTKITLKLIPFGLHVKSNKNIVFSHSEESGISNYYQLYSKILSITERIQDEQTLEYLLKNQFDKISNIDKEIVDKTLASNLKNKEELITILQELKQTYLLYYQIKHQWLMLGWNRTKKSFYIKEKGVSPKRVSFKEFLMTKQFWRAMC